MLNLLYCALFLPLLGFLILVAGSSYFDRKRTSFIGCSTIFLSFVCFTTLLFYFLTQGMEPISGTLYRWIPVEKINAEFSLYLDSLSLLMALIITGIGFLIHLYSVGYMDHEEDYVRYFAFLNFFVFSMLLLVLAKNLLLLFVGWEGVGLASYLLIGFYYSRSTAAAAATKAFVVNRIGDLGLLLGLLLTFYLFGTSDIPTVIEKAGAEFMVGAPLITILSLLYFVGATGKSAQLPLYSWLPDAMEGPTPVSALIHAATMVTAGVYLVVRMHPVFQLAPFTLQVIGVVGAATSLFAALCASGQTDLKRVLAYSTVSQLGLMFLACGAQAFYSAMFHLTTHAFMKALLFLSAGNLVHMLHGVTQFDKMGRLDSTFKKTNVLFLLGVLAMSGIPPLAAFFSKDLILEQEHLAGFDILFYIAFAACVLTAFYLTRAYCLAFKGASHVPAPLKKDLKEAPRIMIAPVAILGVLSLMGGFLGFCFGQGYSLLEKFLYPVVPENSIERQVSLHLISSPETLLSILGAVVGIGAAVYLYLNYSEQLGKPIQILKRAFFVDEFYEHILVNPLKGLSNFFATQVEPKLFDGTVYSTAKGADLVAGQLQRMQSGQIRSYVAWFIIGIGFLIGFFVRW